MSSPVTAALPTPGNLYAATTLAASANIGAILDLTAAFQSVVDLRMTTGATAAATSGASFSCYHVYAQTTTTTTITGGSTTSIAVASATGLGAKSKMAIVNPATGIGELLSVTSNSGTTLTVTAPLNSYSGTTNIYFISQTPEVVGATLGQNLAAATTTYGEAVVLDTQLWFLSIANLDASNSITVELTSRATTAVQ